MQYPGADLRLEQRRQLACHVDRRVVTCEVARARFDPANTTVASSLVSLPSRVAASPVAHEAWRPPRLTIGERRERVSELDTARFECMQGLDQRLGPLRMIEPRVAPDRVAATVATCRSKPAERAARSRACDLLREEQFAGNVAGQRMELTGTDAEAEELGGNVGQLVRLVDYDRVRARQQIAETFLLEHEIGHQQVMVDDDDVGGLCAPPGIQHETVVEQRTVRAETVVARRGHPGPDCLRPLNTVRLRRCRRDACVNDQARTCGRAVRDLASQHRAHTPAARRARADAGTGNSRDP